MSRHQTYQLGWGSIAAVLLLLFPAILSEIQIIFGTEILILALFAVSYNLLLGYCGLLPFGHAALFGVGAYTAALTIIHLPEMHLLLTLLIATSASFVVGVIKGLFCARHRGSYFALISLAFGMFFLAVIVKWQSLTGGDDGISITRPELYLPVLGSVSMNSNNFYYLTVVMVALGISICYLFMKTPLGNSIICMRENENRASFLGYNVFFTRLIVFSVAGFFAGLAGALYALLQETVVPEIADIHMAFIVMLMVIIGGPRHFFGPMVGVVFYLVFQQWLSDITFHWGLFMGIIFILVILYLPEGLISLFRFVRIRPLGKWQGGKK